MGDAKFLPDKTFTDILRKIIDPYRDVILALPVALERIGESSMDTVKITMLGPSRVGKTSLLAAMCDRFNHEIQETELQIDFSEAAAAIQEQLIQLKSIPAQFKSTSSDGVAATMGERKFNFGIGKINKPASLQFEITDFPGEYFQAGAEAKNQQLVKKLV